MDLSFLVQSLNLVKSYEFLISPQEFATKHPQFFNTIKNPWGSYQPKMDVSCTFLSFIMLLFLVRQGGTKNSMAVLIISVPQTSAIFF